MGASSDNDLSIVLYVDHMISVGPRIHGHAACSTSHHPCSQYRIVRAIIMVGSIIYMNLVLVLSLSGQPTASRHERAFTLHSFATLSVLRHMSWIIHGLWALTIVETSS